MTNLPYRDIFTRLIALYTSEPETINHIKHVVFRRYVTDELCQFKHNSAYIIWAVIVAQDMAETVISAGNTRFWQYPGSFTRIKLDWI